MTTFRPVLLTAVPSESHASIDSLWYIANNRAVVVAVHTHRMLLDGCTGLGGILQDLGPQFPAKAGVCRTKYLCLQGQRALNEALQLLKLSGSQGRTGSCR